MSALIDKIKKHEAQIAVIGIGYVGLPLAVEVAKAGFKAVGYDKSAEKVQSLNAARSYIGDISDADLAPLVKTGKLSATTDGAVFDAADVVIICVPTPLNKTKDPDNSFIIDAAQALLPHLHRGQLVILESTTFPGFTREVLLPKLNESGLKVGEDFFLCFSPERVDPGNPKYHTKNTPKVVGGITPACTEAVRAMYGEVMEHVVPVTSTDAAEMVKLLENTFRAVNIGLVNEVAIMCSKLGLDTWEVIDAAATKPFGFMSFYPGPGLGGHCIPVDPLYLSWKLKTFKYNARFIELADAINSGMPELVVTRVGDALNGVKKAMNGSRLLVLGVAYKADIDDVRESPALDVIELLKRRGADVSYHDPYVEKIRIGEHEEMRSVPFENLERYDCVVIVTGHKVIDYARVLQESKLVFDSRNATRNVRDAARGTLIRL
ncbi:MAG TPA: nucleotide sugar dehydrogenase [Polyangia bacterium]